jgi:hypothetical protein
MGGLSHRFEAASSQWAIARLNCQVLSSTKPPRPDPCETQLELRRLAFSRTFKREGADLAPRILTAGQRAPLGS